MFKMLKNSEKRQSVALVYVYVENYLKKTAQNTLKQV